MNPEVKIDIKNNKIIIIDLGSNLSSVQKSQLKYFGFSKNSSNEFQSEVDFPNELLLKIQEYFADVNLPIRFSESCEEIIRNYENKKNEFRKVIVSGRDFKNGIYNKEQFGEINSFFRIN